MTVKIPMPVKGQKIFVKSSFYIDHGRDDFAGGEATIASIEIDKDLPKDHYNSIMVELEERPGWGMNWRYLLENQEQWKIEYAGQAAHADPDNSDSSNPLNGGY